MNKKIDMLCKFTRVRNETFRKLNCEKMKQMQFVSHRNGAKEVFTSISNSFNARVKSFVVKLAYGRPLQPYRKSITLPRSSYSDLSTWALHSGRRGLGAINDRCQQCDNKVCFGG
ncbi:hypothetical protein EVAR_61270_1 [Eumeta japonica]|uniref:Uncharacterized protein n=1 Tax=Eumeta variegata TaxID=151549 RepID=A0A4C1Z606_EUMVA|nr:hypothetical protein EVAR_61270_1 [Eumeta japonica]